MKKTYCIEGMHCKACELLLKNACKESCTCTSVTANHRKWTLTVDWWESGEQQDALEKAVESSGYVLWEHGDKKQSSQQYQLSNTERVVFVLVALAITFALIRVDVFGFMGLFQTEASFGMIFVLWLVASVSTCLAVTWWIIIWFTELVDKTKNVRWDLWLHGSFQIWRLLWFFVFGSLLGVVWNVISLSFGFASILNAIIALVFVYLWLQLLWILPSLTTLWLNLPEKRTSSLFSQNNPYLAPIVWALTFFLPCGFTQSIQLMALASANWLTWWLMMMVFALWTLPWLMALWMGTSFAKDHRKQWFQQIVAVILLIFWLFTLRWSASIWWWTDGGFLAPTSEGVNDVAEEQVIEQRERVELTISHNWFKLEPETTTLPAGKDYEITILPTHDGMGCMTTITMPRIDRTPYYITAWQPITYRLEDPQPGQYSFVCASMGMSQWKIVIE